MNDARFFTIRMQKQRYTTALFVSKACDQIPQCITQTTRSYGTETSASDSSQDALQTLQLLYCISYSSWSSGRLKAGFESQVEEVLVQTHKDESCYERTLFMKSLKSDLQQLNKSVLSIHRPTLAFQHMSKEKGL